MCPACMTTTLLTVFGTGSAGGLLALVAKLLHQRWPLRMRGAAGTPLA
jgi:hypothetical protein